MRQVSITLKASTLVCQEKVKWAHPYRGDLCSELNVEHYELRKDGTIGYAHPNGTHDDVFWSIALAIYATVEMQPEPFLAVVHR